MAGWAAVLIACVVAGLGASAARDGYLRADAAGQLELVNKDFLLGMVNQETGIRGYVNTADPAFLEPYVRGQRQVQAAVQQMAASAGSDPQLRGKLLAASNAAAAWEAWAIQRKASVDTSGTPLRDLDQATAGKRLFDAFRGINGQVQTLAEEKVRLALVDAGNAERLGFSLLLAAGIVAVVILGALGRTLMTRTLRPVSDLAASARDLAAGRAAPLVASDRTDEVGDLSRALAAWQTAGKDRDHLFALSIDMFAIAGFDGIFKTLNPAWEEAGFSAADLTSRPYLEFIHPDDRAATIAEAGKLAQGARTISFHNRYQCKDGSYRWLDWTAVPVQEEELIYCVARDVTAQKAAEEAIQQLNAELGQRVAERDATNKDLEAFTYSVSHDLRAPLRAIHGFVRILVEEYGQEIRGEARRYLDLVAANSEQMGRLVDDLLNFSRLGRQPVNKHRLNTTAVARRALEQLQPTLEGRHVELSIGELPPADADPVLIQQVFLNLIGNAIKYTRGREPARIEVGARTEADGEVVYYVRDNGAGFDMRYAHKLFGVFQRLHRAEEYEGTGVGLALVQRIITKHGGRIWPEASVGDGATFFFTLGGEATWQAKSAA